jgi:hypothetical protein
MAGLQCEKRLWWSVRQPDAPELTPDPAQQALFDRGDRVGALAREHRPGGVLIDFPHEQIEARVEATTRALARGERLIYEASFLQDGIFVAVDILERQRAGVALTSRCRRTSSLPRASLSCARMLCTSITSALHLISRTCSCAAT